MAGPLSAWATSGVVRWVAFAVSVLLGLAGALNAAGWVVSALFFISLAPRSDASLTLSMLVLALPAAVVAVAFALAALAQARAWASRWRVQAAAMVVLVLGSAVSYGMVVVLLLGDAPQAAPSGRTSTTAPGIRSTWDLEFSGDLRGHLSDPEFLYIIQTCGPTPGALPPSYRIHSITGLVGGERVVLTLNVTPYEGARRYEVGRARYQPARTAATGAPAATAVPYRDVNLHFSRAEGGFLDNNSEEWESTTGAVIIDHGELSGTLEMELQPRFRVDGRVLRVRGRWTCSQAEHRGTW